MVKEGYKKVQLGIKETLIPDQWLVKNIDDIVDLKLNSVDPSKLNRKSVKLYSMPAFDENKEPKIIDPKEIGSSKYLVPKECLLFAKLNPRKKRIWLINNEVDYSLCSTEFWPLVKKDENINLDFLHYYFFSYDFQSNPIIKPASSTNSHKRIKRKSFKKVNIPIPPFPEQKKIASILSSVDKSIEKTVEVIEETKELKKGLMQELLTKGIGHSEFKDSQFGKIPKSWKIEPLNKVAEITGGNTPRRSTEEYWGGNIPWLTPSQLTGEIINEIDKTDEYITEKGFKNSSVKLLPIGTVMLTSRATIGETVINKVPMTTNQGFANIICKDDKLFNYFVLYLLRYLTPKLEALAGGSTFLEISRTSVRSLNIPVPPLEEQKKIASILSSVDAKIQKEEEYKAKLEKLKKGLMQKLLTGEIRVNTEMEV